MALLSGKVHTCSTGECVCVHAHACHPVRTFTKEAEWFQQQTSRLRPLNVSQVHLLAHWAGHVDGSLVALPTTHLTQLD